MTEATTTAYRDKEGKIKYRNRERFIADCEAVEGNEFEVVFRKRKKVRSNQQSRYYWGCVLPEVQNGLKELGNDWSKARCHEFLKSEFNYEEVVLHRTDHETGEVTTEIKRSPKSTANVTTTEFMEFVAKVVHFAADYLSIAIPEPSTQTEINY